MTDKEAINFLMNTVADLQEKIIKLEGTDNIREAKNVLTDLKRERNMARSERETSANEMAVLADKLNAGRNEIEAQIEAAEARHRNQMESMRKQVLSIYDNNAATEVMLREIQEGHQEYQQSRQQAKQHHEWMEQNHQTRREELERFGAKEFIEQQISQREAEGLTRLQREHLDKNLRLLVSDPTAFAQQIQQTFTPPEQIEPEG